LSAQDFDSIKYVDNFAFGNDIPVNFQVTGSVRSLNSLFDRSITAGVEAKISNRYSFYTELNLFSQPIFTHVFSRRSFFIEGRRFFTLKKGQYNRPNLNGMHLGIGASTTNFFSTISPHLKLGYQSRFLKYGFFDIGITGGVHFSSISNPQWFLSPRFRIGLAYSPNYDFDFENKRCQILKCFKERSSWLKLDLLNPIRYSGTSSIQNLSLAIDLAYEHKIGKSFSINHGFGGTYSYFDLIFNGEQIYKQSSLKFNYIPEIRYFIGKRKDIAMGNSASNMNGFFVGVAGIIQHQFGRLNIDLPTETKSEEVLYGGGMTIGIQGQILKNLFYEIKAIGLLTNDANINLGFEDSKFQFLPSVKFGYAF